MSSKPLPEPWRSALEPKGIDSRQKLAAKTGIAVQTAVRLVDGVGVPSQGTVDAVAELFNGDRNRVRELAGLSGQDHGPWKVPDEIALLDEQQRAAVEAVIRAMAPAELRRGAPGGDTASMNVQNLASRRPRQDPEPEVGKQQAARRGKTRAQRHRDGRRPSGGEIE